MEVDVTSGHRLKQWSELTWAPWSKTERTQLFCELGQRTRQRSSITMHSRKPTVGCGAKTLMANASQQSG